MNVLFIQKLQIFLLPPQYVNVYLIKLYQNLLKLNFKDCTEFSTETEIINKSPYQGDAELPKHSCVSTQALPFQSH